MHDENHRPLQRRPTIAGIGVDTVLIARFERQLTKTPKLRERLFTPAERELGLHSLAARFAAKEALIKALGGSDGIKWQDLEVLHSEGSSPRFTMTPGLARVLNRRSLFEPQLSMTHDGDMATAFVIIENDAKASTT